MYVIIAPIQIKEGYKDRFIEEMIGDARGSVNESPDAFASTSFRTPRTRTESGCTKSTRTKMPSTPTRRRPTSSSGGTASADWREDSGLQGAGRGATNIWPPDDEWK
ncbi:hypothetical protein GBAR_LOCUS20396 [Geodia barretti]|uniref:Uncharacterized protein n=1 Tax=Geodia barretti TaxID=519541 RepID=A0AA35SX63_GEOBA|nr:hypothetical protein GBAR_LOCUS20396 [Geodia barretti]